MTILTTKFFDAIHFSITTHEVYQKQKRKGKDIPYITHPMTVGMILARVGAEEEVVMAGILHDTIEDSVDEKKVTKEMLAERFGERVAGLVNDVSEKDKKLSWKDRKEAALTEIAGFSHDALLVKSADVIANNEELIRDHEADGVGTFERFNAPTEEILRHTLQVIRVIVMAWPDSPLKSNLTLLAGKLQSIGAGAFMTAAPAKIVSAKGYSDDMDVTCPVCGWQGKAGEHLEVYDGPVADVSCPICEKMILVKS